MILVSCVVRLAWCAVVALESDRSVQRSTFESEGSEERCFVVIVSIITCTIKYKTEISCYRRETRALKRTLPPTPPLPRTISPVLTFAAHAQVI